MKTSSDCKKSLLIGKKQTKGSSRSKLANPNKYKGIDRIEAYFFDYRWGTVYNIITEIKKGLSNG